MRPVSSSQRTRLAIGRRRGQVLHDLVMGDGVAPALPADHDDLLAVMRGAGERCLDRSAPPLGHAPDDRQVGALQRPGAAVIGELRRERLMGEVVLGHHEQARGVLVEPVHDARPLHAADAREALPAMGDQRIDQRAGIVAGGRDGRRARPACRSRSGPRPRRR